MSKAARELWINVQPQLPTNLSGASAGPGSVLGNVWTPAYDSNGVITQESFNNLPAKTFVKQAATAMFPPINAQLINEFRNALGRLAFSTFTYSGAAVDYVNGRMWMSGGGHFDGGNNGIYRFDVFTGNWRIEAYPTSTWFRGVSAADMRLYHLKDSAQTMEGNNPLMIAYDRSSTGFACLWDTNYKFFRWQEAPGPDGVVATGAVRAAVAAGDFHGFCTPYNGYYDFFPDSTPCAQHMYWSFCYSKKNQILAYNGLRYLFARLDGTGWCTELDAQYPAQWVANLPVPGYGTFSDRIENAWTEEDEVTGKLYSFGYGAESPGSNGLWQNAAMVYDPAVGPTSVSALAIAYYTGVQLNYSLYFRAGRRLGWFDITGVAGMIDFDNLGSGGRKLTLTFSGGGSPIHYDYTEGKKWIYLPHLGKLWGFRFNGFTVTEYDLDAMTLISGNNWNVNCRDITSSFTNGALTNEAGSGNVYSRFAYFPQAKMIVAHIDTQLPALYLRVPP